MVVARKSTEKSVVEIRMFANAIAFLYQFYLLRYRYFSKISRFCVFNPCMCSVEYIDMYILL